MREACETTVSEHFDAPCRRLEEAIGSALPPPCFLVNIIHGGLYEYPKALAGGFGGGDTSPNTDSWDRADDDDNALGCTIDIVTRVVYGNDMKEYGFYRPFQIDSAGCIRKIGPETRYTIQS